MRPGSGWRGRTNEGRGTAGGISSARPRKPCGAFWWIGLAAAWRPNGGGGAESVPADELELPAVVPDEQLLGVDDALEEFARIDPRKAELVKLRYFVGMSFEEAASALGIAVPTAKQWWAYARAWLTVELRRDAPG